MRTLKILTAATLAAFTAMSAGAARPPRDPTSSPLYVLEEASLSKGGHSRVLDAAEEHPIQVDPAVVATNPRTLLIDLPNHPLLEAVRTHFRAYAPDWKSWFGTLRYAGAGGAGTGVIYLGYHGDRITGDLSFGGERYRIVGGPDSGQWLVRLDDKLSPSSCGVKAADGSLEPQPLEDTNLSEDEPSKAAMSSFMAKVNTTIDVLAVYPREFFNRSAAEETAVRDFIDDSIAKANLAFYNSGISAEYHLVAKVPLFDPANQPSTGLLESLKWLTGDPATGVSRAPEPAALRDAFGADVVALIIPKDWSNPNWCGVANEPQRMSHFVRGDTTINEAMGDRAFSATRSECGALDFTLAHEIGHNFGLRHWEWSQEPTLDLYSEARGNVFQVGGAWKATVHGCTCSDSPHLPPCDCGESPLPPCGPIDITGSVCNRIPQYSNPNGLYQGVKTGTTGADGRNETYVIQQGLQRGSPANIPYIRDPNDNTQPTANFSFSCVGRTCTFDGGLSTDNAAIPADGYRWDFGDGQFDVTSGRIAPHTYSSAYPAGTSFRVHLVVKDSGGQTNVNSRNVTIQDAPPRAAQFISVSVPTTMTAGQVYAASVTVRNTGTLTWSPIGPQCNAYRLGSANPNDNSTWGLIRAELPAAVPPGGQATINFNVTAPATPGSYNFRWQMLHECVVWFGPLSPDVWVNVQAPPPIYEGYHDIANCRDIYGWAWNRNTPNSPINVNIYRDDSYDATVTANLYRQDLYNLLGNGYHGFDYVPGPAWRDGQWHSATVRFPSGVNLYTTPKRLICNLSMFPGQVPQENNPTNGVVYSVATQFSSNYNGYIKEIGFYRASGETGSNTIHLTTDSGADLAVRTPTCGPSGWCWASLSPTPVAITAGTRYRVWVNTNTYQVKTGCGIGGGITSQEVLNAISGFWVAGNTFPTNGSCSNFFVDVKFDL